MSTQNKHNPLVKAIRNALLAGVAASMTVAPNVLAEEEDEEEEENTVTVTGSRIKRSDIELAAPVQVITREELEGTGLTSVGDILQNIPAAGSAINTVFNNGGDGSTSLDLRNLGSNRLLVLVNGRRWAAGIAGSVDLNNIPQGAIERVEVLKDGASAIYGSDAISGVVNIITKKDFDGAEFSAYMGEWDEGDGNTQDYNFSVGTSSEKGSAFVNVGYTKQEPIFAGDRPISADPVFGTPTGYAGSSGTPLGRFLYYTPGYTGIVSSTLDGVNGNYIPWDNVASRYNYAPENYLLTPQERINLFATASYELTDDLMFSTEVFYTNRRSDQLLAPTPLFMGYFGSGLLSQTIIGANNPYNPESFALDSNCSGDPAAGCMLLLGRRMIEAGYRNFAQDVDSWQWNGGLAGQFEVGDGVWDWDFNYTHAYIQNNEITEGLLNTQRVNQALSDDCLTDPSCVPFNVFGGSDGVIGGTGTITQAMLDYILFTAQDSSGSTTNEYTFNVAGDVTELEGGMMAFAAGVSQSERLGYDQPDALIAAGITSGNSRLPTSGGYNLQEAYVELSMPLLEGLEVGLATRYSDYSNFGDTTNSKLGVKWDISDEFALRATYSEAFRAPTIFELFQGNGDSFPTLSDPCSDYTNSGVDATTVANCQADGVPATYVQPNSQIRITVGGNSNLGPEEAESQTVGVVYSPLDDLSMTLDYYEIEITNAVGTVGSQTIMNECYTTTERNLCDNIDRAAAGNIRDLFNGRINLDTLLTEGVDFNLQYELETDFGMWDFNWDTSYVMQNSFLVDGVFISDTGRAGDRVVLPRIRSNLGTTWTMDDLSVTWNMRYIHHTTENCYLAGLFSDRELCNKPDTGENVLGSTTYHDVQVAYNMPDFYDSQVVFGITNAGDKEPPFSASTFANSFDPTMFDVPGRFMYLRLKTSF